MECVQCGQEVMDNCICIHCGKGWVHESYVTNEDMTYQEIEWTIFWDLVPVDREFKTKTLVFKEHHPTEVIEEFTRRVFPEYNRLVFHTSGKDNEPHTCMRVDFMLED